MVNPALNAALMAAAARRQSAREALLKRLAEARAVQPSDAIALDAGGEEEAALTELIGQAIVRPAGNGRYYLDRHRQKEQEARQGWILLVVTLAALSVLASVLALVFL